MRLWKLLGSTCLVLLAMAGCVGEQNVPLSNEEVAAAPQLRSPTTCSAGSGSTFGFLANWACNDVVRFALPGGMTSGEVADFQGAVATWNSYINPPGITGLPTFVTSGGNKLITVSISGTGSWYCGQVPVKTTLNLTRYTTKAGAGCTHAGNLSAIALHEIGHAIGFQSTWHNQDGTNPEITTHCSTVTARYTGALVPNVAPCQHEVEIFLTKYGIRAIEPNLSFHIITGLAGLPSTLNLMTGQGAQPLVVSDLVLQHANWSLDPVECPLSTAPNPSSLNRSCTAFIPTSNATFTWSKTGSATSMTGSGTSRTITPVQAGTDVITVTIVPSGYQVAELFGQGGYTNKVTVTVTAAPSNLQATALTAVGTTLTWTNGNPASQTKVEYKTAASGTWLTAATVGAGVTSRALAGLTPGTAYNARVSHLSAPTNFATVNFTTLPGPAGTPSGLSASGISATGATLNWTNGDPLSSTAVQYRVTGTSTFTTSQTVNPAVATANLSGLAACTQYDVNLYHTRNGANGAGYAVTGLLQTTAVGGGPCGLNPPTNFHISNCSTTFSGGKTYVYYTLTWTPGAGNPAGVYWQIGEAHSNNSAQAVVIWSNNTGTSQVVSYTVFTTSQDSYFWIRHSLAGGASPTSWVALTDNPVVVSQGCQL
ncbi:MAG: fibronectin type III domain-containing protein [Gemmatimonadales bacterium]